MIRGHLYVERKHPCVWLMGICMAVSVMIMQTAGNLWFGTFWPTVAALMYILIVLFSGDEMLYRTAVPVWFLGLCFAIQRGSVLGWIFCLLFCVGYTYTISGKVGKEPMAVILW